jgi:hypothetical protein
LAVVLLALLALVAVTMPAAGSPAAGQSATPIFVELRSPEPVVVARYQAARQKQAFDEGRHRAAIRQAQDQFLLGLAGAGVPYILTRTTFALPSGGLEVPDRYADLINAVRLEVDGWDVGRIRALSAVKQISVDVGRRLVLDRSVPYIRANGEDSARSRGLRGTGRINRDGSATGQVIAILDTGIHAGSALGAGGGHPMFDDRVDDADFERRNFETNPDTRPVRSQGVRFDHRTHHTKVVYRALFGLNPVAGDDTGHGTMCATTSAGLKARTGPSDGGVVVEGVAPGALLMDYKVCPSLACTDQQIMAALEDAIRPADILGNPKPVATVINMSFGDSGGDPNEAIGTAAGNLQFAGVFPEASAGNDGPDENTIGSPAAHRRVIATAATIDPGVSPNSVDVLMDNAPLRDTPGPSPSPGSLPGTGTTFLAFFAPESNGAMAFRQPMAQYYVDVGLGDTPDQVPDSVRGRICLARRGSTVDAGVSGSGLFGNKATQCAARGGIALVVYNNAPEQIGVVLAPSTIPVFTISGADGDYLKNTVGFESAAFGAISNLPIRLNPADPSLFLPDTAGFSSRGPNNDFKAVKPDITAPGTQILMGASPTGIPVLLGDPDHYNSADGTSFSGPHVAGAAALLRDPLARPAFAPSVARAALMNSATNLRLRDGTPIPDTDDNNFVHETGAGLVEMVRAVGVKAVLGTNDQNGPGGPDAAGDPDFLPSHSFGERGLIGTGLPATDAAQRRTITATLADVSGVSGSYGLSLVDAGALRGDVTRPLGTRGFSVLLGSKSVKVPAGGTGTFDVTIAVDGRAGGLQVAGEDVGGEPAVEFLWYVVARRTDGGETLRMPFFVRAVKGPEGPPGSARKVTGSGWIPGEGGGRSSFRFSARFEGAAVTGEITYEAGGVSIAGNVQTLSVSGSVASFSGACTLADGTSCTYEAEAQDNADPGKGADLFGIKVSSASGAVHEDRDLLGGGNIRIERND